MMGRKSPPRVELLWFADCPNQEATREGSPTVRVNGVDVEPGFADPGDYSPRCRLYGIDGRLARTPDPRWIRDAVVAGGR